MPGPPIVDRPEGRTCQVAANDNFPKDSVTTLAKHTHPENCGRHHVLREGLEQAPDVKLDSTSLDSREDDRNS